MRPIDKKLKYQVDKVVRTAATGGIGKHRMKLDILKNISEYYYSVYNGALISIPDSSDPLRYRANPENLISKVCWKIFL